jgi:hypothetical protein
MQKSACFFIGSQSSIQSFPQPRHCHLCSDGCVSGRDGFSATHTRLILPTVRSLAVKGEPLRLRILALDRQPVERVVVHIRSLGNGEWREIPAAHLGRAVFRAELPEAEEDFEYWISTVSADGLSLVWPATAPEINQTVVVMPGS